MPSIVFDKTQISQDWIRGCYLDPKVTGLIGIFLIQVDVTKIIVCPTKENVPYTDMEKAAKRMVGKNGWTIHSNTPIEPRGSEISINAGTCREPSKFWIDHC